ncbi:uncharacterized protein LOC127793193 isoform X1 [Diospyros lotus]|uniref:uncharacterized protein LOC127793193 isoform X1 n=1 Tax=Diospyros lotus TaxID=55363 RepID=UPI002255AD64|nr:uncharacterized protein LOC127793193 isoform X1 [Diospyros lotus]
MGPKKRGKRRSYSSPTRDSAIGSPSPGSSPFPLSPARGASVFGRDVVVTEEDTLGFFENLQISPPDPNPNPRSFPFSVKQQCWEKAEKIKGRDPDRWRRDPLGNTVFRKLVGCSGCLCHDYDHIVPYSKGGKSILENCQVLQKKDFCSMAHSWCRQQLIDRRAIGQTYPEQILYRKVHTAGFQAVTWIFLNCQPMVMSDEHRTPEDVTFSDLVSVGSVNVLRL